jgi:hypothetical protein
MISSPRDFLVQGSTSSVIQIANYQKQTYIIVVVYSTFRFESASRACESRSSLVRFFYFGDEDLDLRDTATGR